MHDLLRSIGGYMKLGACAGSMALLLGGAAYADDDMPGRVGRVSAISGQLFMAPEDRAAEWAPVEVNYPIIEGDNLWVAPQGRAEIEFEGGVLRIAADGNVHVEAFADRQLALFVAAGGVILRLRTLEPGASARVDTAHAQIELRRPGVYRIDVSADRPTTTLQVRAGEAGVRLAKAVQQALPGNTVVIDDDAGTAIVRSSLASDAFDAWSDARDTRYDEPKLAQYVSRDVVGWRDLDDHGTWEASDTYGPVWYPAVAANWTPYGFGHWVWLNPWGWTWVDDAAWGYAPFHYGRWVSVAGRWGWCPGRLDAHPPWAPALVAWYGGPSWSYSGRLGAPVYGWVPLAWGEPYRPRWRCSDACWHRYNRNYAVKPEPRPLAVPAVQYENLSVPGALTAVRGAIMSGAKPVAINRVSLSSDSLIAAPLLAPLMATKPTPARGSVRVAAAPDAAATFVTTRSLVALKPRRITEAQAAFPTGTNAAISAAKPAGQAPARAGSPAEPPGLVGPAPLRGVAPTAPTPLTGGRIVAAPPVRAPVTGSALSGNLPRAQAAPDRGITVPGRGLTRVERTAVPQAPAPVPVAAPTPLVPRVQPQGLVVQPQQMPLVQRPQFPVVQAPQGPVVRGFEGLIVQPMVVAPQPVRPVPQQATPRSGGAPVQGAVVSPVAPFYGR